MSEGPREDGSDFVAGKNTAILPPIEHIHNNSQSSGALESEPKSISNTPDDIFHFSHKNEENPINEPQPQGTNKSEKVSTEAEKTSEAKEKFRIGNVIGRLLRKGVQEDVKQAMRVYTKATAEVEDFEFNPENQEGQLDHAQQLDQFSKTYSELSTAGQKATGSVLKQEQMLDIIAAGIRGEFGSERDAKMFNNAVGKGFLYAMLAIHKMRNTGMAESALPYIQKLRLAYQLIGTMTGAVVRKANMVPILSSALFLQRAMDAVNGEENFYYRIVENKQHKVGLSNTIAAEVAKQTVDQDGTTIKLDTKIFGKKNEADVAILNKALGLKGKQELDSAEIEQLLAVMANLGEANLANMGQKRADGRSLLKDLTGNGISLEPQQVQENLAKIVKTIIEKDNISDDLKTQILQKYVYGKSEQPQGSVKENYKTRTAERRVNAVMAEMVGTVAMLGIGKSFSEVARGISIVVEHFGNTGSHIKEQVGTILKTTEGKQIAQIHRDESLREIFTTEKVVADINNAWSDAEAETTTQPENKLIGGVSPRGGFGFGITTNQIHEIQQSLDNQTAANTEAFEIVNAPATKIDVFNPEQYPGAGYRTDEGWAYFDNDKHKQNLLNNLQGDQRTAIQNILEGKIRGREDYLWANNLMAHLAHSGQFGDISEAQLAKLFEELANAEIKENDPNGGFQQLSAHQQALLNLADGRRVEFNGQITRVDYGSAAEQKQFDDIKKYLSTNPSTQPNVPVTPSEPVKPSVPVEKPTIPVVEKPISVNELLAPDNKIDTPAEISAAQKNITESTKSGNYDTANKLLNKLTTAENNKPEINNFAKSEYIKLSDQIAQDVTAGKKVDSNTLIDIYNTSLAKTILSSEDRIYLATNITKGFLYQSDIDQSKEILKLMVYEADPQTSVYKTNQLQTTINEVLNKAPASNKTQIINQLKDSLILENKNSPEQSLKDAQILDVLYKSSPDLQKNPDVAVEIGEAFHRHLSTSNPVNAYQIQQANNYFNLGAQQYLQNGNLSSAISAANNITDPAQQSQFVQDALAKFPDATSARSAFAALPDDVKNSPTGKALNILINIQSLGSAATPVPATATVVPNTSTSVPTTVSATATSVPPTNTVVPNTAAPTTTPTSTATAAPSVPNTATPIPATATVIPATATPNPTTTAVPTTAQATATATAGATTPTGMKGAYNPVTPSTAVATETPTSMKGQGTTVASGTTAPTGQSTPTTAVTTPAANSNITTTVGQNSGNNPTVGATTSAPTSPTTAANVQSGTTPGTGSTNPAATATPSYTPTPIGTTAGAITTPTTVPTENLPANDIRRIDGSDFAKNQLVNLYGETIPSGVSIKVIESGNPDTTPVKAVVTTVLQANTIKNTESILTVLKDQLHIDKDQAGSALAFKNEVLSKIDVKNLIAGNGTMSDTIKGVAQGAFTSLVNQFDPKANQTLTEYLETPIRNPFAQIPGAFMIPGLNTTPEITIRQGLDLLGGRIQDQDVTLTREIDLNQLVEVKKDEITFPRIGTVVAGGIIAAGAMKYISKKGIPKFGTGARRTPAKKPANLKKPRGAAQTTPTTGQTPAAQPTINVTPVGTPPSPVSEAVVRPINNQTSGTTTGSTPTTKPVTQPAAPPPPSVESKPVVKPTQGFNSNYVSEISDDLENKPNTPSSTSGGGSSQAPSVIQADKQFNPNKFGRKR